MLARRARALAHGLGVRCARPYAASARTAPAWTGDEDGDARSGATAIWTRHGSPESASFAHRGISADDDTKVRAERDRGGARDAAVTGEGETGDGWMDGWAEGFRRREGAGDG